jgi:hypothetical protein
MCGYHCSLHCPKGCQHHTAPKYHPKHCHLQCGIPESMKSMKKSIKKQDEKDKQDKQDKHKPNRTQTYNKYIVEKGTSDRVYCQSCTKIILTQLMYNLEKHVYFCFECFIQGKQPHGVILGLASSYKIEDQKIIHT